MVRKSVLLIFALCGIARADTGFTSTIKVTEADSSPSCVAGQLKFSNGTVTCSGQTATITNTGGGGGSSSLQVTRSGVEVTSPTASINFYSGDFLANSVGGTTSQIFLNPATTDYIRNITLLESKTFNVSSGTVNILTTPVISSTGSLAIGGLPYNGVVNGPLMTVFPAGDTTGRIPTYMDGYPSFGNTAGSGSVGDATPYTLNGINDADAVGIMLMCGHSLLGPPNCYYQGFKGNSGNSADNVWTLPSGDASGCFKSDGSGNMSISACGGTGGGYAVEPATVTFNLAKGYTASTGTITGAAGASVTYGLTVGSLTVSGIGNLSFFNPPDSLTYQIVGSSVIPTAGHLAVWGASNTIVDGGSVGSGGGGGYAVEPATVTFNLAKGVTVSTITVSSNAYVVGAVSIGTTTVSNQTKLYLYTPSTYTYEALQSDDPNAGAFTVWFNNGQDSDLVAGQYGSTASGTYFGGVLNAGAGLLVIEDGTSLGIGSASQVPVVFGTNNIERMRIDGAGAINIQSSTTVRGAGGLGVSYGVVAATITVSTITINSSATINNVSNLSFRDSHISSTGTAPSLSSCGTGPSIIGSDLAFTITGGTSATGCTATFATAFGSVPTCSVSQQSMSLVNALTYTVSATAITISQVGLGTAKLDVQCIGHD